MLSRISSIRNSFKSSEIYKIKKAKLRNRRSVKIGFRAVVALVMILLILLPGFNLSVLASSGNVKGIYSGWLGFFAGLSRAFREDGPFDTVPKIAREVHRIP